MKITNEQIEEARLCAALRTGGADLATMNAIEVELICGAALRDVCGVPTLLCVFVVRYDHKKLEIREVPRRFTSTDIFELFDRLFPCPGFDLIVRFEREW